MLSAIFLSFALVHIVLWVWGWKLWAGSGRPIALLLLLVANTLLFYDNLRIGVGRFIGDEDILRAMTYPAFAWHWTFLPLLIIAAGSLARLARLPWARHTLVMAAFCVFAVALSIYDTLHIFSIELYPACIADTVRMTTNVSAAQLCNPGDPVITTGAGAALGAILTNAVVLAVGIALWIQRDWKWLALGAGAMFVAAGAFARSPWSLPIANTGEIILTASYIWTCVHFARLRAAAGGDLSRSGAQPQAVR